MAQGAILHIACDERAEKSGCPLPMEFLIEKMAKRLLRLIANFGKAKGFFYSNPLLGFEEVGMGIAADQFAFENVVAICRNFLTQVVDAAGNSLVAAIEHSLIDESFMKGGVVRTFGGDGEIGEVALLGRLGIEKVGVNGACKQEYNGGPFPKKTKIPNPKNWPNEIERERPKKGAASSNQKCEGQEQGWLLLPKEEMQSHEVEIISTVNWMH